MKLAVLFSGGKDSCYALWKAMQKEEVACLITVVSENPESYMFHTPNIDLARLQAEALGLPVVMKRTKGEEEKELADLKEAIIEAKQKYGVDGIVTGAIASVYQASRIQKVCRKLGLWCFNPLWQKDQSEHLNDIVENGFHVIVTAVFARQLDENWLGRKIDKMAINDLNDLATKHGINPAGEGGEMETFVADCPAFRKRVEIQEAVKEGNVYRIKKARLVEK